MISNFIDVVTHTYPASKGYKYFAVSDYESLVNNWGDCDLPIPSLEQLEKDAIAYEAYKKSIQYRSDRLPLYDPLPEQLDKIYWDLMNGTTVWRDSITAVKKQVPKP